eukprot:CAMPEP_0177642694 /NCGR_PEP_ID=MMETSP0447-20121125/7737_1 /TAXON_ID=0 /ORGANISM="Stygamoeba regulata, Strain BSH-02190019" /LENGTH=206 /DNA_ID=CAMNT_0019144897 /DNA_START=219 /DNA_END=839 /DNA_ORIENTATION=-
MRLERAVHFPWAQVRDEFEVITHSYERLQEEIPDVFAHFVAQPFGIPPQNVPVPELLRTKLLPELEKTQKMYALEYQRVYPESMSKDPHQLKDFVESQISAHNTVCKHLADFCEHQSSALTTPPSLAGDDGDLRPRSTATGQLVTIEPLVLAMASGRGLRVSAAASAATSTASSTTASASVSVSASSASVGGASAGGPAGASDVPS